MASQPAAHPAQPVATSSQRVPPAAPSPGPSGTPSAPTLRPSLPRRLITAYLQQLSRRPLRTKMITSSFLFFLGDSMAQFGIEGRRLPWSSAPDVVEEDPTLPPSSVDRVPTKLDDSNAVWDPLRAARLVAYGGLVFAPLAHTWLNLLQKVQLKSRFTTIATRVALDQGLWGPFVVCLFWGTNGILEGKTPDEVAAKVKLAFLPVYMKSVMVFGPTAIVSFTFVPLHLRLLVGQTVGLGWNTYLSYINHINNQRLASAAAALSVAQSQEIADPIAVERSQAAIERAKSRHDKLVADQGGGATGVGIRMGH